MFQFFVQVHCNPVKITFKVQERVIWNLWIWGKYFSAHFFHYFPLKSLPDLLWLPVVKIMNLGEVFLPHIYHICGGGNFWSTKDSFVEFSLNFCTKTISVRTTLRLFWTFIPHICHIHFATREFWRVFFLFYSSWTLQDVSPRLRDSILSYFNSCHKP